MRRGLQVSCVRQLKGRFRCIAGGYKTGRLSVRRRATSDDSWTKEKVFQGDEPNATRNQNCTTTVQCV